MDWIAGSSGQARGQAEPGNDNEDRNEDRVDRDRRKRRRSEAEALRRFANMLCLWRLCGNAACRRAKSCRGRSHLCNQRYFPFLPEAVRDWFECFLAAKYVDMSFEAFKEEMEDREETDAFFAWRKAVRGTRR